VVKKSLKKELLESKKNDVTFNIKSALLKFLFSYRNTPCTVTQKTPAELVLKKRPKSKVTDLNPILTHGMQKLNDVPQPNITFQNGENVLVRNVNDNVQKWQKGIVECKMSNFVYKILVGQNSRLYHVDQIKKFVESHVKGGEGVKDKTSLHSQSNCKNAKISGDEQKDKINVRKSHRAHKPVKRMNL
jgi:hypothetical protein